MDRFSGGDPPPATGHYASAVTRNLLVGTRELYATTDAGLDILTLSMNLQQHVAIEGVGPMARRDDYLYVAAHNALEIVDVRVPTQAALVKTIPAVEEPWPMIGRRFRALGAHLGASSLHRLQRYHSGHPRSFSWHISGLGPLSIPTNAMFTTPFRPPDAPTPLFVIHDENGPGMATVYAKFTPTPWKISGLDYATFFVLFAESINAISLNMSQFLSRHTISNPSTILFYAGSCSPLSPIFPHKPADLSMFESERRPVREVAEVSPNPKSHYQHSFYA